MNNPQRQRFAEQIESLRKEIFQAFSLNPVPRWPGGKGKSIEEIGCRKYLAGKRWDQVGQRVAVDLGSDCVFHWTMPSIEHTAYYLPSFLDGLLASWPEDWNGLLYMNVESVLTYTEPDALLPRALTARQRRCVAAFIDLMAEEPSCDEEDAILYRLAAED